MYHFALLSKGDIQSGANKAQDHKKGSIHNYIQCLLRGSQTETFIDS